MPCLIQTIFFSLSQPKKTDDLIQPIFVFLPQPKKTDDLIQPIFFSLSQPKKTDDLIQPIFFSLSQPKKTGDEEEAHHRRNTFIKHPLQVDELEEVSEYYQNRGCFKELIALMESGLGLERAHMGIFTELGILYARFRHEKLMEHIKLFSTRLNVTKLIRACDEQQHWKELTYLYIQYDEFDNAAATIMNHSPEAWDHLQFKDVVVKVGSVELYYKAVHFYLEEHPDLINDLLNVLALRVDHTRVVDIMRKDYDRLRESIDLHDNFDQIGLAQKIGKHELLEMRRVAAYIYKKAGRWKQSIALSKKDSLYKDAMETCSQSGDRELSEELLVYFIEQCSAYYHNDSALPTTTVALTDNCLKGMTICQILGFNVKGWCGRLVFSPSQCLIFPAPKPFFCCVYACHLMHMILSDNHVRDYITGAGSSRQQRNQKVWLLPPFTYDYKSEKYSSPKDYYAGIRAEWAFRVTEQEGLFNDLRNFGALVPHRHSLTMARRNVSDYEKAVSRIKKENNRMLMRRCRHFMLQLATEMAEASNRDLTVIERNNVLNNEKYLSDYYIMATWFMGGSGSRRGGRNLQRSESSRRGGGRGNGDAEDEPPFPLLDASCAYHDRFGKRHFVMPKYYRDPCGLVEDPSENQTGYGYAKARLLKWPALFIERVQNERLCRERRLKVPKARSVEIQKEDPDNVDRLCQTLQREISQMGRRLARDMQLLILKKDAQKNRTEPNVAAIKGIMEDPELVSDAELSDCSDSEPPADLSAN
ncbi:unnamed protein product [Camellia sinensis]